MTERADPLSPAEVYYRAARFLSEPIAWGAYTHTQELLAQAQCELSSYRFTRDRAWYTVVVGKPPHPDLDDRLEVILSSGDPTTVPEDLLQELQRRRLEATRQGPWVEHHYDLPIDRLVSE
jgi:hypothetical protein